MSLVWDYSDAAATYAKRPAYCDAVVDDCLHGLERTRGGRACDVGAGTGVLTLALARRGLDVVAVEPNAAMRALGREQTAAMPRIRWIAACGETLSLARASCDLVGFGSSFNVVDSARALVESARILAPGGRIILMWNHRRLDDPLQARIEAVIRSALPSFDHGSRRADQTPLLEASGLFARVRRLERETVHHLAIDDVIAAWRSHVTLRRQAGALFDAVIDAIGGVLASTGRTSVDVPYTTRAWIAERVTRLGC